MEQRLTWVRRECGAGKSCAGEARHRKLPGGKIMRGYVITDPEVLADLGTPAPGEFDVFVPDDMPEV